MGNPMPKIEVVERFEPPKGPPERPFETRRGYKMADPGIGPNRHLAAHAIYVKTLDEVAERLKRGYSLWMKQPGKRETLISAGSLRVGYA
jgi:hypothetical protein